MAPERLKRNISYLHVLNTSKKSLRDAIIKNAPKDLIVCICDCSHNFLNGNIPFTAQEIKKLLRYQNLVRYLAKKKRGELKEKRQLIVQNGGFLPLLLTPILSVAASLLAEAIRK
jgi:hypothetical protein